MPSYAIHLAIANEIIRKNKNNIIDKNKFLLGSIAPDLEKDKAKSHNGVIKKYIKEEIKNDYEKGYLLHVITDDEFYLVDFKNEYFKGEYGDTDNCNNFYKDYDKLSPILISRYNINWYPEEISKYMQGEIGQTEYLKQEKIFKFIEKMSSFELNEKIKELKENNYTSVIEVH